MPASVELEKNNLVVNRLSGKYLYSEHIEMLDELKEIVNKVGDIKLLIFINDFLGWEESENWADISASEEMESIILKAAIIVDKSWNTEIQMFTYLDFRKTPVKLFEPGQETDALEWLESD